MTTILTCCTSAPHNIGKIFAFDIILFISGTLLENQHQVAQQVTSCGKALRMTDDGENALNEETKRNKGINRNENTRKTQ